MSYHTKHRKALKTDIIPRFFLFAILGFVIPMVFISGIDQSLAEIFFPAPIIYVAEIQKPLDKETIKEIPVKKVIKKVAVTTPLVIATIPQARLKIAKINVDAVIKDMGVTSGGLMAVPGNSVDVGWFRLGTRPGEIGSAVIGGHNIWSSQPAVFDNLNKLERGDIVSVVDAKGIPTSFVVTDVRTYSASDADSGIFESDSGIHLNLITCSGSYDSSIKTHTTRLVVFTDLVAPKTEIAMASQ